MIKVMEQGLGSAKSKLEEEPISFGGINNRVNKLLEDGKKEQAERYLKGANRRKNLNYYLDNKPNIDLLREVEIFVSNTDGLDKKGSDILIDEKIRLNEFWKKGEAYIPSERFNKLVISMDIDKEIDRARRENDLNILLGLEDNGDIIKELVKMKKDIR
jgi:hypothetical protein